MDLMNLNLTPNYERVKLIYENMLECEEDIKDFVLEGPGICTFPKKRMRMESSNRIEDITDKEILKNSHFVYWLDKDFPDNIEITWDFYPIREPGLAIMFFAASGVNNESIFDNYLKKRNGVFKDYHSGDFKNYFVSYFRRNPEWNRFEQCERNFQVCILRKSPGHIKLTMGLDGIPPIHNHLYGMANEKWMPAPFRMKIVKMGPYIAFYINDVLSFQTIDKDNYLTSGKIGFRQMAPMIAEYANLKVYSIK